MNDQNNLDNIPHYYLNTLDFYRPQKNLREHAFQLIIARTLKTKGYMLNEIIDITKLSEVELSAL